MEKPSYSYEIVKDPNTGNVYQLTYAPDSTQDSGYRVVSMKAMGSNTTNANVRSSEWIQSLLKQFGNNLGSNLSSSSYYVPGETLTNQDRETFGKPSGGLPADVPGDGNQSNVIGGGVPTGAPVSPITGMPRSAWSQALHDAMSQWVPGQTPHPLSPQAQMKYDPVQGAFVSTAPPPPKWNPVENIMAGKPAGYPMPPFDENGMIPNMPVPPVPEPAAQMAPVSPQMPVMPNVPTGQTMPALPNVPPPPPMSGMPQSGPWTGRPPFLNPNNGQFPGGQNPLPMRQGLVPMGPEAYLNQLVNNGPGSPVRKMNLG